MAAEGAMLGAAVGAAALFGIYADLAYNVYSATNSSPQTTELFAGDRADTLMKYVRLGGVQVAALGIFGAIVGQSVWPLIGAGVTGVIMHMMYSHALAAGKAKMPPAGAS